MEQVSVESPDTGLKEGNRFSGFFCERAMIPRTNLCPLGSFNLVL